MISFPSYANAVSEPPHRPLIRKPAFHIFDDLDLFVVEGAAGLLGEVEFGPALDGGPELVWGRGPKYGRGPGEPRRRRLQAGADELAGFGVGALSAAALPVSAREAFFSRRPPVA